MLKKDIDLELHKVECFLKLDSSKEEALDFLLSLDYPSNVNEFLSSDLCTKEVFEYFYNELKDCTNCLILWYILEHPKCPIEIMKRFHIDLDVSIWAFVAKNISCKMEILNDIFEKTMSKFDEEFERESLFNEYEGILNCIFENENCSIDLMEKFVGMEDLYISKYSNMRMKYFYSNRKTIESRHKVGRDINYFIDKYNREATNSYYNILINILKNDKCPKTLLDTK